MPSYGIKSVDINSGDAVDCEFVRGTVVHLALSSPGLGSLGNRRTTSIAPCRKVFGIELPVIRARCMDEFSTQVMAASISGTGQSCCI